MPKYSIGVDFGTLSGRAVLVEVTTGEELASSTFVNLMRLWMKSYRMALLWV